MPRIALVTGANQGLGLALTEALARRLGKDDVVYLAARSETKGQAAKETLKDTIAQVRVAQLDVTDQASISKLAATLSEAHGGIDLVASNAAHRISKDLTQAEQVREFVATNNHGSRNLYRALEPVLKANARYVMVASSFGQLSNLPVNLHPLFDTDRLGLDDIEANLDEYVTSMEDGTAQEKGWPDWINVPSKIGQVATVRIAARDLKRERPQDGIAINAVCPGLIDTAASRPWFEDMSEAQSPREAAKAVVDLLLEEPDSSAPSGELFQFGKTLPWL